MEQASRIIAWRHCLTLEAFAAVGLNDLAANCAVPTSNRMPFELMSDAYDRRPLTRCFRPSQLYCLNYEPEQQTPAEANEAQRGQIGIPIR